MARNGSGTYSRVAGVPYVYNTVIDQAVVNAEMDDIATALTASLAKDGQTAPTANLPMATFRHTGVGNASARTDYAAAGQVQDGKLNWVDGGGTADAITATYSPAITALVDGQLCCVRATAANATTTPTFAPNGLTARAIVRRGGGALVAGSIAGDGHELILRYDLANTQWEFLNSQSVIGADVEAYAASRIQTCWIPAGAMVARTTNGAATGTVETTTNKNMIKTLDFDATTAEYAQFSINMPKGWDEGTVTAAFVWSHAATTTNFGVAWELAGVAVSDDDALDVAFGTAGTVTDTGGTTNDCYITAATSAITIAGTPAVNDLVMFQVNRAPANGSDTMAIDARLHGVRLMYSINTLTDA